jgi:DNA-binding MarR family transcriptional regulator
LVKQHYKVETYQARQSVGFLIKRANALVLDNLEPGFAESGFTFMQWVVLMQLRSGLALNLRDICTHFRHDSGALTRVVDQLVERGLIERQRAAQDRRKVDLHLTRTGLKRCEELIPLVVDKLNRALADFSSAEFAELIRLLLKFNIGLQSEIEREVRAEPALRARP